MMIGSYLLDTNWFQSWTRQYSGTENSVSSVQFIDRKSGYALAESRALLKIRPGIIDWTDIDNDGDVDGKDLAIFVTDFSNNLDTEKLKTLVVNYGK